MNFSSKKNVIVNLVRGLRPVSFESFHTSRIFYEKNYYEVLNVKLDCSPKEIRDSFIRLAKKCHPDVNPNDPKSHAQFVELQKAYSILSTPSKRHDYDVSLRSPQESWRPRKPVDPMDDDSKYYHETFSDEYKEFIFRSQRYTDPNPPAQVGALRVTLLLVAFTAVGAILQYIFLKREDKQNEPVPCPVSNPHPHSNPAFLLRWLYRRSYKDELERHQKATASYYAMKQEMDKRSEEYDLGKLRAAYFKEINGLVAMHLVPDLIRPGLPGHISRRQNDKDEVPPMYKVEIQEQATVSTVPVSEDPNTVR